MQHAEHYYRIHGVNVAANAANGADRRPRPLTADGAAAEANGAHTVTNTSAPEDGVAADDDSDQSEPAQA